MEEIGFGVIATICLIIGMLGISLLIRNYREQRQCDILGYGNTTTEIYYYYEIAKVCYVKLDSGKLINADNYRGFID